jgi:hypothetical protein
MKIITHAVPYLLASIALYSLTLSLFRRELFAQLNAIRVGPRHTNNRQRRVN